MDHLILFIGLIPLISKPIENKIMPIQKIIGLMSRRLSELAINISTTFILANFINLASIPISKSIFISNDMSKIQRKTFMVSNVRSFGLAMLCTPIGAAVAVSIDMTNSSFLSVLGINILITLFGLLLSLKLQQHDFKKINVPLSSEDRFLKQDFLFLLKLFVPFLIYFMLLSLIDETFSIGMMESIVVSILPFTITWSFIIKSLRDWGSAFKDMTLTRIPTLFGQFSVIICAGLAIHTIELVRLDYTIIKYLPLTDTTLSPILYIPLIIMVVPLLAVFGIHQFVVMVFIGEILDPALLGINHVVFASVLLVGFVSAMVSSSFSGANLLANNILPEQSAHDFASENYKFVMFFILFSSVLLILINFWM
ncbi:hypothetical protein KO561_16530 [Radiobacillus kanasensis]|uniref:hypothetical protein n=1 Tax=Radiobacillus kanasensis TaxID=2844358 RepID=UPI001E454B82|nr:hypothetical protein [Radiobacillus kanasensis]UFT98781.1 hypothetical protein KO561_16530 [Radiobacillus kanasensis]